MAFECQRCLECCQRYWITLLPFEAKALAKCLGLKLEDFVRDYCEIYLQVFPKIKEKGLNVSEAFIPGKIKSEMDEKNLALPGEFTVLPWLSLKRVQGQCVLLAENRACLVHDVKPLQCQLFPFISLKKGNDFREIYSFCQGLKKSKPKERMNEKKFREHLKQVKNYFSQVKEQGFQSVWGKVPSKGLFVFQDLKVCDLNKKEFLQFIAPFQ